MNDLFKILFGGLLGFGVAKLMQKDDNEGEGKEDGFYVFVASGEEGDKDAKEADMTFGDPAEAKKTYSEIASSGSYKFGTDENESKVSEVKWGSGDVMIESKEF